MTHGTRPLDWADRLDGWARDLRAARAELGLDHSPDPYLLRQLAKAMRAGEADDPEAGTKTGPDGMALAPNDPRGADDE